MSFEHLKQRQLFSKTAEAERLCLSAIGKVKKTIFFSYRLPFLVQFCTIKVNILLLFSAVRFGINGVSSLRFCSLNYVGI